MKSDRHARIARAAKFNIFLDATTTKEQLALLLEIDPEEIYVVQQETPNHGNLNILQITGMGKLGKDRSESLKRRVAALRRALEERYPGIIFGEQPLLANLAGRLHMVILTWKELINYRGVGKG